MGINVHVYTVYGVKLPWDICGKMESDSAKVQCMETYYE